MTALRQLTKHLSRRRGSKFAIAVISQYTQTVARFGNRSHAGVQSNARIDVSTQKAGRRRFVTALPGLLLCAATISWIPPSQAVDANPEGLTEMFFEVDVDAAINNMLETLVDGVRVALRSEWIGYRDLGVVEGHVAFRLRDNAKATAAAEVISDAFPDLLISDQDGHFKLALTEDAQKLIRASSFQRTYRILHRMLRDEGEYVREVRKEGTRCIVVRGSFLEKVHWRWRVTPSFAKVTLRLIDRKVASGQTDVAPGLEVLALRPTLASDVQAHYAVRKRHLFSGDQFVDTSVELEDGRPTITVLLDYTGRNVVRDRLPDPERLVAIELSGTAIAVVRIHGRSPDRIVLHGAFTTEQAHELADLLLVGPLPVPVKRVDRCADDS